jgi:biopolymer transport protein ExbD
LADISLVLLIILMLITPMVMQSMINISPSGGEGREVKDAVHEKPLIVEVRPDGFWLNKNKMDSAVEPSKRFWRGSCPVKTIAP